jgi:hypothetical protein
VRHDGLRDALEAERERLSPDVLGIGSMLSYDERALLQWAARTGPPGAVVDLGSFLGGSTLALARGTDRPVHAYDRFIFEGWEYDWLPDGFALRAGKSTRPAFDHNIAAVADRVVVHEGDVEALGWPGDPIGVLFVDITKAWDTADAVWSAFLPSLTTGGLLIQQDLVHWGHPWCAIVMEHLAEHFDYLGWVWYSSAVYRLRSPVRELPVPMLEAFTCEQMLALLARAAQRVGEPAAGSVRLAGAVVYASFGRFHEARARLADIARSYDDSVLPHIEEGFAHLRGWIDDVAGR